MWPLNLITVKCGGGAGVGVAVDEMTTVAVLYVLLVGSTLCAAGSPPRTCYLQVKSARYVLCLFGIQ